MKMELVEMAPVLMVNILAMIGLEEVGGKKEKEEVVNDVGRNKKRKLASENSPRSANSTHIFDFETTG